MKKILLSAFVLGSLFNCSSDDDSSTIDTGAVLPTKIVMDEGDGVITILLSYNGDKLKEINATYTGDENYTDKNVYEYVGNNISKISNYVDGKVDMTQEYSYTNGKVSKLVTTENILGSTKYVSTSVYTWTGNNQMKEVTTYSSSDRISTNVYTYTNGNLTKIDGDYETYIATFDNKNNPTMNIKGLKEIGVSDEISSSVNNILSSEYKNKSNPSDISTSQYTYKYNSAGYPTESTELNSYGDKYVTTYTYNK